MEASKFITNGNISMTSRMNEKRVMVDEELKEIFGEGKDITYVDYECLIDSKANIQEVYTKEQLQHVMEAYYGSAPEIASNWYEEEMSRREAEIERQNSIKNMQNTIDSEVNEMKKTTNDKMLEVDTKVNEKILEIETLSNEKINEIDGKIVEVNVAKDEFTSAMTDKLSEASDKIDNVEDRMLFIENNFDALVDGTGFATQLFVSQQVEPKANKVDVYNKNETYTKKEVDAHLKEKQSKIDAIIDDAKQEDRTTWSSNKIERELDSIKSSVSYNDTYISSVENKLNNTIDKVAFIEEENIEINKNFIENRFYDVGEMIFEDDTITLLNNKILVDGKCLKIERLSGDMTENQTSLLKISTKENTYDIESQVTLTRKNYNTENGICKFNSEDGYMDTLFIEGETWINLCDIDPDKTNLVEEDEEAGSYVDVFFKNPNRISNGEYTFANMSDIPICLMISYVEDETDLEGIWVSPSEKITFTFDTETQCHGLRFDVSEAESTDNLDWYTNENIDLLILEGNYSDEDIPCFKRITSIGQGNKVSILTHNDCEIIPIEWQFGNINEEGIDEELVTEDLEVEEEMDETPAVEIDVNFVRTDYIDASNFENIWTSKEVNIYLYDAEKNYFGFVASENNYKDVFLRSAKYIRMCRKTLDSENTLIYVNPKYDKSNLYTTISSLPHGVRDTVEKHGDRYVKVQRCGEIILDGSEEWYSWGIASDRSVKFTCKIDNIKPTDTNTSSPILICDRFKPNNQAKIYDGIEEIEGISSGYSTCQEINISIFRSKLETEDEEGFKTWLQSNPVTVIYELDEPVESDIEVVCPKIYDGITTVVLDSGMIQGDIDFEVYEYLPIVYEEGFKYFHLAKDIRGDFKDLRVTDPHTTTKVVEGKDLDSGIFTVVKIYRQNNTLKQISVLSDKVDDNFTTQTISYYDELGMKILYSEIYSLKYDEEGDLIGQEWIKRC